MEQAQSIDVLLVEDNPQDAELILRILNKQHPGQRILHLVDGAAATELIFGGQHPSMPQPKVIFLDLKLPKVDGHEVLRAVKSDERTRMVPVIVLTSSREDSDIRRAYALGANSYVVKPVNYEDFQEALQRLGAYWLNLNRGF